MGLNTSLHKLLAVHWLGSWMVMLRSGAQGSLLDFQMCDLWD